MSASDLERFVQAQEGTYLRALSEITDGKKRTHWMWFIFPQIRGLGSSEMSDYYGIRDVREAERYLSHPVLGTRVQEISAVLLRHKGLGARSVFGSPDDMKLRSSMTLFGSVRNSNEIFQAVLDAFFDGEKDFRTLELLAKN